MVMNFWFQWGRRALVHVIQMTGKHFASLRLLPIMIRFSVLLSGINFSPTISLLFRCMLAGLEEGVLVRYLQGLLVEISVGLCPLLEEEEALLLEFL